MDHHASLWTGSEIGKKNYILHANDYNQFIMDLKGTFEDPNLKINAANEL